MVKTNIPMNLYIHDAINVDCYK